MNAKQFLFAIATSSLVLASCQKNDPEPEAQEPVSSFNFATTQDVLFHIETVAPDRRVMPAKNIEVYDGDVTTGAANLIARGLVNELGVMEAAVAVPTFVKEVYIYSNYPTLLDVVKVPVSPRVDVSLVPSNAGARSGFGAFGAGSSSKFNYPFGTSDNNGVPNYLAPNQVIPDTLLNNVNASLPERSPVPVNRPAYIAPNVVTNLPLTGSAQVSITFIGEGAAYLNSFGFFTFPTGQTPTSESQIIQKNIIFPNTSLPGSSGNLAAGSTVNLGTFPAGTSLGWFVAADAYNPNSKKVKDNSPVYYSVAALNPESTPAKKAHCVLLYDGQYDKLIIGMEDLPRNGTSDEDFNDVLFYVTVTPSTNIDLTGIEHTVIANDSDNDGVKDSDDDYPNDGLRAHNNYYPGKNVFGTLAYEDLWPSKGDYDFNDLVINYNHNVVTNGQGKVVEVKGRYKVAAIGASFRNGFAIELPVAPNNVASVSGSRIVNGSNLFIAANGTENGQPNSVFFVTDDAFSLVKFPGGAAFFNTDPAAPRGSSDTLEVTVRFVSPITTAVLGASPWNPFITINGDRTKEVHLIDYKPTAKADVNLFGTADDLSNILTQKYYRGTNSFPWALHLPATLDYPIEKVIIGDAHLRFNEWANTNGFLYPDWYLNRPGYRNNSLIFE